MTAVEKIKAGDKVTVIVPTQIRGRASREVPAVIEKAGRVWLEIRAVDGGKLWKMRQDTQMELVTNQTPGGGIYEARFRTNEQMQARRGLERSRATAEQLGKDIAALLRAAGDELSPEKALAAQSALGIIAATVDEQLAWVEDGIA